MQGLPLVIMGGVGVEVDSWERFAVFEGIIRIIQSPGSIAWRGRAVDVFYYVAELVGSS